MLSCFKQFLFLLPINGSTAAVAHAAVTAVTAYIDAAVPLELFASLEEIIAVMMTHSHCNSHDHSNNFNHPSIHSASSNG